MKEPGWMDMTLVDQMITSLKQAQRFAATTQVIENLRHHAAREEEGHAAAVAARDRLGTCLPPSPRVPVTPASRPACATPTK